MTSEAHRHRSLSAQNRQGIQGAVRGGAVQIWGKTMKEFFIYRAEWCPNRMYRHGLQEGDFHDQYYENMDATDYIPTGACTHFELIGGRLVYPEFASRGWPL
jgi:hypothetical protein